MFKILKNILSSIFYVPGGGWEISTGIHLAIFIYLCIPNASFKTWLLVEYRSPFFSFPSSPLSFSSSGPDSRKVHKASWFQKSPWPWSGWMTRGASSWLRAAGLGLEHVLFWGLCFTLNSIWGRRSLGAAGRSRDQAQRKECQLLGILGARQPLGS